VVLEATGAWFPTLRPVPRNRFRETATLAPGGDLANIIGLSELRREEVLALDPIDTRKAQSFDWPASQVGRMEGPPRGVKETMAHDPGLPRLVMFHDSFGNALVPFLSEHFSRAVHVSHGMGFDAPLLERERPDVVFQELTERYLWVDFPAAYENRP